MIDITQNIELQISLLLFVSLVGYLIAQRIGQSVVVGEILVDVNAASGVFVFVVILTIVAIITKMLGGYLPAKLLGVSHKESIIIGLGIVPRGEIAMIAALIGLNAGVIG